VLLQLSLLLLQLWRPLKFTQVYAVVVVAAAVVVVATVVVVHVEEATLEQIRR